MALTKLKTSGIADDAVTTDKLANAINTERTANTAKVSLTDNSVTLAKMAGGTDGQIITYDASGDPVAVGPGTDGQVLTSTGAGSPPAFETLPTSGATLTGSTDNTICTVTGANAIAGEATLTYDDPTLKIDTSSSYGALKLDGSSGGLIEFHENGTRKWEIYGVDSSLQIYDRDNTSYHTKFLDGGDLEVFDGNIKFAAGHGIDFSAQTGTGSGTNQANESELLDHYEEGKLDPTATSSGLTFLQDSEKHNHYIRIGKFVTVSGYLRVDTFTSNAEGIQVRMPFTSAPNSDGFMQRGVGAVMAQRINVPSNCYLTSYVGGGENYMRFYYTESDADFHQMLNSDLTSNTIIYFSITYAIS